MEAARALSVARKSLQVRTPIDMIVGVSPIAYFLLLKKRKTVTDCLIYKYISLFFLSLSERSGGVPFHHRKRPRAPDGRAGLCCYCYSPSESQKEEEEEKEGARKSRRAVILAPLLFGAAQDPSKLQASS